MLERNMERCVGAMARNLSDQKCNQCKTQQLLERIQYACHAASVKAT